jgi:voltage-gated potassium channel
MYRVPAPVTIRAVTGEFKFKRRHGNAYEIFILVLTIFSLLLIALQLLPIDDNTRFLVGVYDDIVCVVFLIDFAYNVAITRPRREYFIDERGWLDLIGSIPVIPGLPYTGLLRLARVARLVRIRKALGGQAGRELLRDVIRNRGQYAVFITLLSALIVLSFSSIAVLQFESKSPAANIRTGGDALWWAVVTITTVGYGDLYPVTALGRLTAVFVMVAGVGIIGALASILASFLVTSPAEDEADVATLTGADAPESGARATVSASPSTDIAMELARLTAEVAALRQQVQSGRT